MWHLGVELDDIRVWCEKHPVDVSRFAPRWEWVARPEGRYYGLLAAYARLFGVRHCTEIGSGYGASSACIGLGAKRVTTWDIRTDWIPDPSILGPNVTMRILREPKACVEVDFSRSDMVFIDIGTHEGKYERRIHERLSREYCGVVVWDDVNWEGMKPLWNDIKEPKLKLDWHGEAGMGLTYYGWPGPLKRLNLAAISGRDTMPYMTGGNAT